MKIPSIPLYLKSALVLLTFFLYGFSQSLSAQEETVSTSHKFTLGTYYSEGVYGGDEDTEILYLPLSYEIGHFPWVLSVTVPYLDIKGPGDVFLETGNIGRNRETGNDRINAGGLGDVFLSASYQFPAIFNSIFVDFSLQTKIPTADETRDLGTGEMDYGPQLDFYTSHNRNTYFSTIGYRWRGKTPLYDLQDSVYGSLGMMRQFGENTYLGLAYDYRQKASSSSVDSHELMPFVSYNLNDSWNLMLYTIVGFTDSSADRTYGFQVSYSLP